MAAVLPLFHSTSIVFIDDDSGMLNNLIQVLDYENKSCPCFKDPFQGLDYINANTYRQQLIDRLVMPNEDEEFCYQDDAFVHELFNAERYDQISVLVVDYDMPGITGLQVCQRITNPSIKKILLTGAADESLAIDAFNQGLIYQFIRKQDPQFIDKLHQAIDAAQQQYFQEIAELPVRILAARYDSTALVDPAFKTYFDLIVHKHRIVEYYLVEAMGNFILIDDQHQRHCLMTLDDGMIEMYLNCKSSETLSHAQIDAIEHKQLMPCYYDPFNDYGFENPQLAHYLHQPTVIPGLMCPYYCVFGQGFFPIDADAIVVR